MRFGRHAVEPEGDLTSRRPHLDQDPSRFEGPQAEPEASGRAHEVEHRARRRDGLAGVADLVGAELTQPPVLGTVAFHRDHARGREELDVLDGELPEAAGADHEGGRVPAQPRKGAPNRPVRGEARVRQRGGLHRVEVAQGDEVARGRDADPLRVPAVLRPTRLRGVRAQLLVARSAEGAATAAPAGVHEDVTHAVRVSCDLVAEDQGQPGVEQPVREGDVAVAHAAPQHSHQHVLSPPAGSGTPFQPQRPAGAVEHGGPHA